MLLGVRETLVIWVSFEASQWLWRPLVSGTLQGKATLPSSEENILIMYLLCRYLTSRLAMGHSDSCLISLVCFAFNFDLKHLHKMWYRIFMYTVIFNVFDDFYLSRHQRGSLTHQRLHVRHQEKSYWNRLRLVKWRSNHRLSTEVSTPIVLFHFAWPNTNKIKAFT